MTEEITNVLCVGKYVVVVVDVVGSEAFSLQDKFLNCRKNSFVSLILIN